MQIKRLSQFACVLALAALPAFTYAFDWETSLEISKAEPYDNPTIDAAATYYFSPVNHGSSTPWEETTFTDRIAFFQLSYGYQKETYTIDFEGYGGLSNIKLDSKTNSLKANYTHRSATSPHSFSAYLNYTKFTIEQARVFYTSDGSAWIEPSDIEIDTYTDSTDIIAYGANYSYYLQDNWTIGIAAAGTDEPNDSNSYTIGVHTNKLWNLANSQWFGLQASISRSDTNFYPNSGDNWLYEIEGRYYFNVRTGLSLGFDYPDNGLTKTYSVGLLRYITDQIAIAAGYEYIELDLPIATQPDGSVPDNSQSNVRLKLSYRF